MSAFGEWVVSDHGYRDRRTPQRLNYTRGTAGHNTVMVDKLISADGETVNGGQVRRDGGAVQFLFDGAGYAKVTGDAADTYEPGLLSRFGRRIQAESLFRLQTSIQEP